MEHLHEIHKLIVRHAREDAFGAAAPGLVMVCADGPTDMTPVVYEPMLCLVAAGAKRAVLGDKVFTYAAGDYLTVSVGLPVTGQVTAGPYSAFGLPLDAGKIAALALDAGAAPDGPGGGLQVHRADADLLDPLLRYLRLVERPRDLAVLGPMIEREILWRLLHGPSGATVRQIARADSRMSAVARAIGWLRDHYAEPFAVEDLARLAGMSPASFHRHFKAATAMSPLQYQKQIRLQEARARLLGQGDDVANVGFAVGYGSPSQFSREYARLFGAPPRRDVLRLRRDGEPTPALV